MPLDSITASSIVGNSSSATSALTSKSTAAAAMFTLLESSSDWPFVPVHYHHTCHFTYMTIYHTPMWAAKKIAKKNNYENSCLTCIYPIMDNILPQVALFLQFQATTSVTTLSYYVARYHFNEISSYCTPSHKKNPVNTLSTSTLSSPVTILATTEACSSRLEWRTGWLVLRLVTDCSFTHMTMSSEKWNSVNMTK